MTTTTYANVVSINSLDLNENPEMRAHVYPVPDASNLWVEDDIVMDYYHGNFREDYNIRNQHIIHWSCLERSQQEAFGNALAGIALKYALSDYPDIRRDDLPSIDPAPYLHEGKPAFSLADHVKERLETLTQEERAGRYDEIVRQLSDQFEAPNSLFVATLTEVEGGTKFTGPGDGEFTLLRTGEIRQD